MVEIRRNAVRLTRDEIFQPLMVIDENSSQTDSSDEMDIFIPNAKGMIRLEEIPTEPPAGANLTLAIATTDDVDGGRVGSYMKGKGVMTGPDIRGGQLFGLQMGSGSGFANTEGADVALEEDEAYAGEQKLFVDRDAFKVHMSLHALANKYIYFKRKSEPGKLVLECSGVNCQWRVYAAKITGCPLFEIKTLDNSTGYAVKHIINNEYEVVDGNGMYHRVDLDKKTCSCKEFGALAIPCAHASCIIYARESVESTVAVYYSNTYWGLAYSGSINPAEQANIDVYKFGRRRTCSICGGTNHNKVTCKMPI
ncbi:unnamed protein product [Brassica oleracea]